MKSKRKIFICCVMSLMMALVMAVPMSVSAAEGDPTVTINMDDRIDVGKTTEFTVSTTPGNQSWPSVLGKFEFDGQNAIEKLEYLESQDGNWYELKGNSFGPESGFPLMKATSKFRVTFKDSGTFNLKVDIVDVATQTAIVSDEKIVKVGSEPAVTANLPESIKVGVPTEFQISTIAGYSKGTMVLGTAETSGDAVVEKLEYKEVNDGQWYELKGDFGPEGGFPLDNITSDFRVTFKEAGTYNFTVKMKPVGGGDAIAENTFSVKVVDDTATNPPTDPTTKPGDGTQAGDKTDATPQTGDDTNLGLMFAIMGVAAAAAAGTLVYGRRRHNN